MGTQAKLNTITLLTAAVGLLFSFFVWSSHRWIDRVEAQSAALEEKHQAIERKQSVLSDELEAIHRQLLIIDGRTERIEQALMRHK